jgi:anti-sigma B factor antagonist
VRRRGTAPRRVEITGELTIHTAAEQQAALLAALEAASAANAPALVVNLGGVTELDTAGLQVLLLAQREAAGLGRRFELAAVSQAVTDVLAIVHLDHRLAVGGPQSRGDRSEESVK